MISRPYRRESLEILISPLAARENDWLVRHCAVAAIFVAERSRVAVAEDSVLIRLHGLTATEAKVAVAVSRGLTGKEICRTIGFSYNTLKTHLKRIYAKTHTSHQSDLVRLLAGEFRFTRPDAKDVDAGPS
jgi:DNA-binding CsgD family transcriptional regulator